MALLHFISHGKRQKLHLYIHIMNKKNLNYVIAKYGITFFWEFIMLFLPIVM